MKYLEDYNENSPLFHANISILNMVRHGQKPLWEEKTCGLLIPLSKSQVLDYQKKGINNNEPLARYFTFENYDLLPIRQAFTTLLDELGSLSNNDLKEMKKISTKSLNQLISYGLNDENGLLDNHTTEKAPILSDIISGALVQPSMIYLSSMCSQDYLDAWEKTPCPVCGKHPTVAIKNEEQVWRFKCTFCHASYKMDIFTCPSCGQKDMNKLEFMIVGENQEFEIAFCDVCNHYFKIINITRHKQPIQEGFEDIYTKMLDAIAREKGLVRLGNAK